MPKTSFYASLRDGSKEPAGTKAEKKALQRANMESAPTENGGRSKPLPYRYLKHRLFPIYQKHSYHFAARRNITPQAHHFPLAENITRRRRTSLCNRHMAIAPRGTAKRWKEPAGMKATICLL